jgi:Golgi SNAP receptor complex protein 1
MAMPLQSRWEELRKESRRLENEVDQKLVSFSKLGSSYSHRDSSSDPALGGTGHVFDTLALEIEQLLGKLRRVNSSMNEYVSNLNSSTPTTTLYHTLQRHNEILQDYGQEFNRTKSNILAQRQREELLGSSRKEGYKGSALNRRTELYLKEHEHIQSSDKLTDEAISIAISTKENLSRQRDMFTGMTSRVAAMTSILTLYNGC